MTQMCQRRFDATHEPIPYPSSSSKKTYKVYLFRGREGKLPLCTCFPYLTSRKKRGAELGLPVDEVAGDCRHVRDAAGKVCPWSEHHPQHPGRRVDCCPMCGSTIVDVDDVDDLVETSREDATAQLLALRARAAGRLTQ